MFTIQLKNLIFHSFHGLHAEERILGNSFEVNVDVSFDGSEHIDSIGQTINYASLYEIIKLQMARPADLLETLAQDIVQQIHSFDKRILSITISITKRNPPITGIIGSVGVKYHKNF